MTSMPLILALSLYLARQDALQSEAPPSPAPPASPAPVTAPATPSRAAEPVAPAEVPPPLGRTVSRVTLRDGQVLRGFVMQRDAQRLVLELANGDRMELAAHSVERVEEDPSARVTRDGELWFEDPNRTQYFYAPSGMMLRQGEASFSLTEGVLAQLNYGVLDHLTLQVGTVAPAWVLSLPNVMAGLKVGGSPGERVHLSAGVQAIALLPTSEGVSRINLLGLVYGTTTYGTPNAHLSLTLGVPFSKRVDSATPFIAPMYLLALSGNLRVGQRVALVTENWLVVMPLSGLSSLLMANSAGVRLFGDHWAVALGAIRAPSTPIPLPWIDLTYHFGR